MLSISENGLKLIERFEGFSPNKYWDPYGKVWTIGYGTTTADGPLPASVTQAQAEQLLKENISKIYAPPINALEIPLNQNQFDALCSLVYNCGDGVISASTKLGHDLRNRNFPVVANDFLAYTYAGGVQLPGLVTRRSAERSLFLTPVSKPVTNPSGIAKVIVSFDLAKRKVTYLDHIPGQDVKFGKNVGWIDFTLGINGDNGEWRS